PARRALRGRAGGRRAHRLAAHDGDAGGRGLIGTAGGGRMKVVVLDDYQGAALSSADWSGVASRAQIDVVRHHIEGPDELARRLDGAEVVVLMRERTPLQSQL